MIRILYRMARFGAVGLTGAALFFVTLLGMVEILGIGVMYSTTAAYIVSSVANYVSHHVWTFKSEERHAVAFPKYVATGMIGFVLNLAVMYVGVELMALNYLFVQCVSVLVIVLCSLLSFNFWVFRD
jgi:putative flippase GtrA